MVTCWWIDTLPASAIFIMLLVKSSSVGRQQGSELGREWELRGAGAGGGGGGPSPRLALFSVQANSSFA